MHVPTRDTVATIFVALALIAVGAWAIGALPSLVDVGAMALTVLVLGIAASASAVVPGFSGLLKGSRLYLVTASAIGVVALASGLWALYAGDEDALALLVLATAVMWAMSTLRHAWIYQLTHRFDHP